MRFFLHASYHHDLPETARLTENPQKTLWFFLPWIVGWFDWTWMCNCRLVGYLDPWRCICPPEFPSFEQFCSSVQFGPFCIQRWGALQMITDDAFLHDGHHYAKNDDDGNYCLDDQHYANKEYDGNYFWGWKFWSVPQTSHVAPSCGQKHSPPGDDDDGYCDDGDDISIYRCLVTSQYHLTWLCVKGLMQLKWVIWKGLVQSNRSNEFLKTR